MTDYTVCSVCASDECEHALEPSRSGIPRWEVEVERTTRYRFGVLAETEEEAKAATSEAIDPATWEPNDDDEWVAATLDSKGGDR